MFYTWPSHQSVGSRQPAVSSWAKASWLPSSWALQTGLRLGKKWMKKAIASSSLAITQTPYTQRRRMTLPTGTVRRTDTSGRSHSSGRRITALISAILWWSRDPMHWRDSSTEQFISAKARYTDKINGASPIKTFMVRAQIAPYSLQLRIIN